MLLMMGLYETHARWKLDVVAGEWRHMNPPAQAHTQGAAPRGQGPPTTDPVRAEIAVLEAQLAQLWGPPVPHLSLGELQREHAFSLRVAASIRGDARHFPEIRGAAARLRSVGGGNYAGRRHVGRPVADSWDPGRRVPCPAANPAGCKGGAPWGLLQVRAARPLGAQMQQPAILVPVLPTVATAMAAAGGSPVGTAGAPGRGSLCPRRTEPVHGVQHRSHV